MLHQLLQLRVLTEEMLTGVGASVFLVGLIFAVHALFHTPAQQPLAVPFQQRIPETAPDHLDHIPAGAPEHTFQLLDDLAVTAHRTIQPLQVAVDHEDQIIQFLATGQRQGTQGFGLVHFAVTQEGPHLAVILLDQLAVLQVLHDVGLVNGLNRPQPHGHGGKLPEIRHQPRMWIGRQALAIHLPTKVVELLFADAPFQVSAGIHPRGGMALEEHQVPFVLVAGGPEEMIETHIVKRGG